MVHFSGFARFDEDIGLRAGFFPDEVVVNSCGSEQ